MGNLYNKIELLCRDAGLNITALCKQAGVSRASLSELKSGRSKNLTLSSASKIAAVLGVSVGELSGEENSIPAVSFDDFTFAMHNEGKELSEESKKMLIEMAGFLRQKQSDEEKK